VTDSNEQRSSIDWARVRERLARSAAALEPHEPAGEQARATLDQRARALAQPLSDRTEVGDGLKLVVFSLGTERYAIEARYVREAVRVNEVAPIPGAADLFLGLVNLRGDILPIADLRRLFGIGHTTPEEASWVLILGEAFADLGAAVTEFHETVELPAPSLLTSTDFAPGQPSDLRLGVTETALIVIDGAALLKDRRLFVAPDRQARPRQP
jgi:purine-binding chemotaxis protein CheW